MKRHDSLAWVSSNGLHVQKRTTNSIILSWSSATLSPVSSKHLASGEAESPEFFYEIDMRRTGTERWENAYTGYKTFCEVKDLLPDSFIHFRLKKSTESEWGTSISAATEPSLPTAEDLFQSVICDADDMVVRIIANSSQRHLRQILGAHDSNGRTALMIACQNGNPKLVELLINAGSVVNAKSLSSGKTALICACGSGHFNIVQLLDNFHADPRIKDSGGLSALSHAINGGNVKIAAFIFDKIGSQVVNERDIKGWTPLLRAVIVNDQIEISRFLIIKGADVNSTDLENNKSILMACCMLGKVEFVRLLLNYGANPFYKNNKNRGIREVAADFNYTEIENLVYEAEVKRGGGVK